MTSFQVRLCEISSFASFAGADNTIWLSLTSLEFLCLFFKGGNNNNNNNNSGNNNNNNNANSSKEEFRKYLEKAGVMDALTKVLVGLYEEPDRSQVNALEYLKKYLGAPQAVDVDGLKRENEDLKKQVEKMKKQLASKDGSIQATTMSSGTTTAGAVGKTSAGEVEC